MRAFGWMLLLVISGCGSDDNGGGVGTAASCAGNYAGAYSGDSSGTVTGTLATDGSIQASFLQSGSTAPISGTGALQPNGSMSLVIGGNYVTGTLDASCHAAGTWNYPGVGQGNWAMQKQ